MLEFFLILFGAIWVFVLPIVLPIVFGVKTNKLKKAIIEFYKQGDISYQQLVTIVNYIPLKGEIELADDNRAKKLQALSDELASNKIITQPTQEPQPATLPPVGTDLLTQLEQSQTTEPALSTEPSQATQSALSTEPSQATQSALSTEPSQATQSALSTEPSQTTQSTQTAEPLAAQSPDALAARVAITHTKPATQPASDDTFLPIPTLLAVGVVLICTAGAAFISSIWGEASNISKLLSVGSFSLIFFGAFGLAKYKLQIDNSAKAFYVLGVVALAITVTAAELFGLVLADLSTAAQMLIPTLMLAGGMFLGYRLFNTKLFPVLGMISIFLFLSALSCTIFGAYSMMFFIPAVFSTAAMIFVLHTKKEKLQSFRVPVFALFIVFTVLQLLCSLSLTRLDTVCITLAFSIALTVILHIQAHKTNKLFVDCAIPVALGWAALLSTQKLFTLEFTAESQSHFSSNNTNALIVFSVFAALQCASAIATFISDRRHHTVPHLATTLIQIIGIATLYMVNQPLLRLALHTDNVADFAIFSLYIPTLTLMVLGAHMFRAAKLKLAIDSSKTTENATADLGLHNADPETSGTQSKIHCLSSARALPSAIMLLMTGGVYTVIAYASALINFAGPLYLPSLFTGIMLLAFALIQECYHAGNLHCRRITSLILFIVLTLCIYLSDNSSDNLQLQIPKLAFIGAAFALTVIERAKLNRENRTSIVIPLHGLAIALSMWFVTAAMMILDNPLNHYIALGNHFHLKDFIIPTNIFLLATVLFYESKKPLVPNLWELRLATGAILLGASYMTLCHVIDYYQLQSNDLILASPDDFKGKLRITNINIVYSVITALYAALTLFYALRKKVSHPDAPHLRLRGATALLLATAFVPHYCDLPEITILFLSVALMLCALGLVIVDDRRSAALKSPKDQTIAAVMAAVIVYAAIMSFYSNVYAFFDTYNELCRDIERYILAATAVLSMLAVATEHFLMHKRDVRPYRLVAATCFELTAAIISLYVYINPHYPLLTILLLVSGLGATACFSFRENRKYGICAATAVFVSIYALSSYIWHNYELADPQLDVPKYFLWIITAALTAAIAFADGIKHKGFTPVRVVWGLAALPLLLVTNDVYNIAHAAAFLVVSLNLLQYLRERGKCDHDRALISASIGLLAIGISLKVLMMPAQSWLPTIIRPEIVLLVPLAAAYLVAWKLWKFRYPSHDIASAFALIGLPLLYLIPDTHVQFHAIVVTALSIGAILVALRTKFNRYLVGGILCIVIIFFSQTKNFWLSLRWWVYLAIVGVLLLVIAVVNETLRRKGTTLPETVKKLFSTRHKR